MQSNFELLFRTQSHLTIENYRAIRGSFQLGGTD